MNHKELTKSEQPKGWISLSLQCTALNINFKVDPEEMKRLVQEREILQKNIATMTEDATRCREEISKLKNTIANLQNQLKLVQENLNKAK